ncbi:MAG: hypothetical protein IPM74_13430 [Crocinitomicaceae bacterium]|nr:hypothetical protein [Crocinitomicaceae bacterium]
MKKLFLPLLTLVLLSCNNNAQLNHIEKKMLGSWHYSKVEYKPNFGFNQNFTDTYSDITLQFNSDLTVTLSNDKTLESYSGVWEVNDVMVPSSDGSTEFCYELIASLSDDISGTAMLIIWENLNVTSSKITATHNTQDGWYTYKLRKD